MDAEPSGTAQNPAEPYRIPGGTKEGRFPVGALVNAGSVPVHYLKSVHYRVIHAAGVYGGIGPKAVVFVNFFSERNPIPQVEFVRLTPQGDGSGKLGSETFEREGKVGFVREVEVGIAIPFDEFESIVQWMDQQLACLKQMKGKLADSNQKKEEGVDE